VSVDRLDALRLFFAVVLLYLAVLAGAGLELGSSAARGPGGTMSSELIVDGCRAPEGTGSPSRATRVTRKRLPRADGDLSFHVARSADEVLALRSAWATLQGPCLNSDIDVFLAVVEHAPGVVRPHVLVAEAHGAPVAVIAARLEDTRLSARVGYIRFSPRLRMLTVAHGGFMTTRPMDAAVLLDALRRSLGGDRIDLVRLRMLTVGSAAHAGAREWAGVRRRRFAPAVLHWQCAIPGSFDEFLSARSKERRRHVRRYQRRLEEAFQGDLEVRHFTRGAELDRLFADTERVQRRTYQRALGVGFADTRLSRHLTALSMDKGWFRGAVLYLGGEPAAFWHGNAYRGTFATTFTGYDPDLADYRPGTFLLMRVVERLCADPAMHTLDFGFGDADYKRSFGERSVLEEDVIAFEPRPRPLAVDAAMSAVLGAGSLARGALSRSGALRAVRRTWRRRLRRGLGDAR
jgi:CelD/BcsL family acetyltransferase involved in cellulose biosynthesis